MPHTPLELRAKAQLILNQRRKENSSKLEYYRNNPLDYIQDRLGVPKETINWASLPEYRNHTWDGTPNPLAHILNSLVQNKWVGVESAVGVGKTFLGACALLWFLECFPNSLVVTSAPKEKQLSLHIWKEVGKLYSKFKRGELTSLRLRMIPGEDEWIAVGFVAGIKANEESSTKAQGFHSEYLLIILEETPGIPVPIITAFENTCTSPHNLILAFGNPDHQLDALHRFCKYENVEHVRISAYDHPNVVLNNPNFIPGAQSSVNLRRMEIKWGIDNPLFKSRAKGISPSQSTDSLIKLEWCYECVDLDQIGNEIGLGVDVANSESGDKACLVKGIGNKVTGIDVFACPNANQLGHKIIQIIKDEGIKTKNVGIDGIGVGAATVNTLYDNGYDDPGINLQSASSPIEVNTEERFNNLRSQMWWELREDLRNREISLPKDEELFAELVTPEWTVKNGKITVESKEDIKKRLGHSPNRADATVYWNWKRKSFRQFFKNLKEDVHIVPAFDIPADWKLTGSIWYGFTTTCIWMAIDPSNNVYNYYEWTETGRTRTEKIRSFNSFCEKYNLKKIPLIGNKGMFDTKHELKESKTPAETWKESGYDIKPITKKIAPDGKDFNVWCNDLYKDHLRWKKDKNGLWVEKPKMHYLKGRCNNLWRTLQMLTIDKDNPEDVEENPDIDTWYNASKYGLISVKGYIDTEKNERIIKQHINKYAESRPF